MSQRENAFDTGNDVNVHVQRTSSADTPPLRGWWPDIDYDVVTPSELKTALERRRQAITDSNARAACFASRLGAEKFAFVASDMFGLARLVRFIGLHLSASSVDTPLETRFAYAVSVGLQQKYVTALAEALDRGEIMRLANALLDDEYESACESQIAQRYSVLNIHHRVGVYSLNDVVAGMYVVVDTSDDETLNFIEECVRRIADTVGEPLECERLVSDTLTLDETRPTLMFTLTSVVEMLRDSDSASDVLDVYLEVMADAEGMSYRRLADTYSRFKEWCKGSGYDVVSIASREAFAERVRDLYGLSVASTCCVYPPMSSKTPKLPHDWTEGNQYVVARSRKTDPDGTIRLRNVLVAERGGPSVDASAECDLG